MNYQSKRSLAERKEKFFAEHEALNRMHNHEHEVKSRDTVYEYCRCGAVRKQKPVNDPWHVCKTCATPGYEKELGIKR